MERGATLQALAEEAEQAAIPNLLQNPAYAEQALPYGGMNKTLSEYADMCPLDLNDPNISAEAIDSFAVKFINKAGGEVRPQDADYFRSVLASKGIEPQFKVAEPRKQPEETAAEDAKQHAAQERARNAAKEKSSEPAPAPETESHRLPQPERTEIRAAAAIETAADEYAVRAQLQEAREAQNILVPQLEAIQQEQLATGVAASPAEYRLESRVQPDDGLSLPRPELLAEMSAADTGETIQGTVAHGDGVDGPGERLWSLEEYVALEVSATGAPTSSIVSEAAPLEAAPTDETRFESEINALPASSLPVLTGLRELLGEPPVASPAQSAGEVGEPQLAIPAIDAEIIIYAHERFAEAEPERELYIIGLSEEAAQIAEFLAEASTAPETETIDADTLPQPEAAYTEQALQRLEVVCERILQELEIPYDAEQLAALRNTFIQATAAQALSVPQPEEAVVFAQPDEGTHESKLDIWLDDFMGQLSLVPVLRQFAGAVALHDLLAM